MPIHSRNKGKRGERLWRDKLREHGFQAKRGQQNRGGEDSPDVICPDIPGIHWEVKFCQQTRLREWLTQAQSDCGSKIPAVAHKRKNDNWIISMDADEFLEMIKESEHVI